MATLYQTNDGGRHWQFSSEIAEKSGEIVTLAGSQLVRLSMGSAVETSFGTPIMDGFSPPKATVWDTKPAAHSGTSLLATTDGGTTYQDIHPSSLRTQPQATVDGSGEGFDLCSPTVSQLQTWYTDSPYRYANVYIGGTNAACTQPNLSQSWVTQVTGQGWGLIPTWVGLQAPCSSCTGCSKFSSTASTAGSQGVSEAQSAASTMSSIGLAGSVVYYDLQEYSGASSCDAAASAFVNGWVQEMHALGYTAGVYGSPTNANSDWLSIANSPDAVWLALWNGSASVENLSPVPNTDWANHQRIHQYSGGVNETYGGVTLNIDQDYLDGPVATSGAQPPGFSLSASPAALSIAQGASATSTITASVFGGFNAAISLSASGLPTGVSVTFSPASIAAPGSGTSTMTVTAGASTAIGSYSITITGTGGGITEAATVL